MSKDIVWITMHKENLKYLRAIFKKYHYDICVEYSQMDTFFQTAKECVQKDGTKVLIVRGGTGSALKQQISVPVVDLKNTYIDYYATLDKAFQISDKVALVGWYQHVKNFDKILKDCGEKLMYVELEDYGQNQSAEMIRNILFDLRGKGINTVIGGGSVIEEAKRIGMTALYVGLEKDSVIDAAEEATHLLKVVKEQIARQEIITSIFNCVTNGVVAVDMRGFITNANSAAKKLLKFDEDDFKYIRFSEMIGFPELQQSIERGDRLVNQILQHVKSGDMTIVLSTEPIVSGNRLMGAVCTIQLADMIKLANKKLKASNIERGLYAKHNFDHIIGSSQSIQQIKHTAIRYAETEATVLIMGESGTGKELFAQSIHNESSRRGEPFVALNCASIPEMLLESELFGYVKGSFTGANPQGKEGVFERANHGTLFLDEISEISINVQAHLLRAIQEKEIMRVGDDRIIPVDVRILAASNADMEELVATKRFRKDLYYRLCVLPLYIPPIRERGEDSFKIAEYLLRVRYGKDIIFTPGARQALVDYKWPGNVREISNFVERINAIINEKTIDENMVGEILTLQRRVPASECVDCCNTNLIHAIRKITDQEILDTLTKCGYSKGKAAQQLGISTTTLWRRIKKMSLE